MAITKYLLDFEMVFWIFWGISPGLLGTECRLIEMNRFCWACLPLIGAWMVWQRWCLSTCRWGVLCRNELLSPNDDASGTRPMDQLGGQDVWDPWTWTDLGCLKVLKIRMQSRLCLFRVLFPYLCLLYRDWRKWLPPLVWHRGWLAESHQGRWWKPLKPLEHLMTRCRQRVE